MAEFLEVKCLPKDEQKRILDEIEKNQLLVRVRGLALEPQVARPGSGDDEDAPRDPVPTGVIEFQMIVDGFARIEEYGP